MRRILVLIISIFVIVTLCIPAMAANYASRVDINAVVASDKSCRVTASITLHIEEGEDLQFPIPLDSADVTLEGSRIRTKKTEQAQIVDLSRTVGNMTGDLSVTIGYTLPDVIGTDETGNPELQLPLLSGFKSPISQLDFKVTLPGELQAKPAFSSGYHHAGIEKDLSFSTSGNAVTGGSLTELKDHETLTMYLSVDDSWFPDAPLKFFESDADDIAMLVCGILALLYWLIFLRFLPSRGRVSPAVPEGITAGQLNSVLTLGNSYLSLMVLSWAQMGYLQLRYTGSRVVLYKAMDMGNERSAFEQQCFKKLFGKKDTVNTAGVHYATQCRAVAKKRPNLQSFVHKNSGNTRLFRALCGLISLFGGVSFGIAMTQEAVIQGIWVFLTAVIGLLCGYGMQEPVGELFLRKTRRTVIGLVCAVIWLLLGLMAGQFGLAVILLLVQWLAGAMAFYGGRRTEAGKQTVSQVLGLRQYLNKVSPEDIQRISAADPEYFYTMVPYALALGVGSSFAKRFQKTRVPECPYIVCRSDKLHSAKHWVTEIEKILLCMDRRSHRLPLEQFMAVLAAARNVSAKQEDA